MTCITLLFSLIRYLSDPIYNIQTVKIHNVLLLVILVVAQPYFSSAQEPKVKVRVKMSRDDDADDKRIPMKIVAAGSENVMMLRTVNAGGQRGAQTNRPKLTSYSLDKLSHVGEEELKNEGVRVETIEWFGGRTMVISTAPRENGTAIVWREADMKLKKHDLPYQEIITFPGVESGRSKNAYNTSWQSKYNTKVASDENSMLIVSPEFRDKESGLAVFKLVLVGTDMKPIWAKMLIPDKRAKRTSIQDVAVDASGNAYLVIKENFSAKDTKSKDLNFELVLYKVHGDDVSRSVMNFDGGVHPRSALIRNAPKGGLLCAGTYANTTGKDWWALGNFVARAAPDGASFSKVTTFEFPPEKEDKKYKGYAYMYITDLLVRSDGGGYIVNDRHWWQEHGGSQGASSILWHHADMMVISLDANGTEEWITHIDRFVTANNKLTGTVMPAVFNDKLYVFTIDEESHKAKRKEDKPIGNRFQPSKMFSAYFLFKEKGKYREKTILTRDKDRYAIQGNSLQPVGDGVYMCLGSKGHNKKKSYPVKITFTLEEQ